VKQETNAMKAAIYARVSTLDQEPENQLQELRRYLEARGWTAVEYVDRGVSGAKDSRPALDGLVRDAKRRRFDVLACWQLDRLGRNLRHLILLLDDLQAVGIGFVTLGRSSSALAGKLAISGSTMTGGCPTARARTFGSVNPSVLREQSGVVQT
jgi:DNA invertase Pin-like site-specific DNA recombinase